MAKQRRKDPGPWDRFMLWVDANQKVFWVVLLAVISFTFAFPQIGQMFRPAQDSIVFQKVFGESFTKADKDRLERNLAAVSTMARRETRKAPPSRQACR